MATVPRAPNFSTLNAWDERFYRLSHRPAAFLLLQLHLLANVRVEIALKDRRVLGDYDDELTAITETQKSEKLGTFIVQRVTPGEDAYTIRVNSRVVFS